MGRSQRVPERAKSLDLQRDRCRLHIALAWTPLVNASDAGARCKA